MFYDAQGDGGDGGLEDKEEEDEEEEDLEDDDDDDDDADDDDEDDDEYEGSSPTFISKTNPRPHELPPDLRFSIFSGLCL